VLEGLIVFLGTSNLEETHYFYSKILKLPLYKDQGLCRIYDVPGGGKLGFCQHLDISINGKSPIITLLADDVDKMYQELIDNNVVIDEKPKVNPKFNIYHFFVRDPNGYCVEIQKFL
jgi:catechol 2,3-dioxygenase-like lactoylglutathione lyase family enzyme